MENDSLQTDNVLFQQIAGGNEMAFGMLFRRWKDRVFTIAKSFTEHQHRSEEIVQDVFLHLWTNRTRLLEIDNPEAWIYTITRNRSLTAFKILARDKSFRAEAYNYLPHQETASEDPLHIADLHQLLEQAMQLLTPQQRQVFKLARLKGYSREEVAEEMGIAKATVSVHLTVALRTVRAFLLARLDMVTVLLLLKEYF